MYRNKVQEYAQKKKAEFPEYKVVNTGGMPHRMEWKSSAKYLNKEFKSPQSNYATKKEAIDACAKEIYNYISSISEEYQPTNDDKSIQSIKSIQSESNEINENKIKYMNHIFVDLDNSRHSWKYIIDNWSMNEVIMRGYGSPMIDKSSVSINSKSEVLIVSTHRKDAADFALAFSLHEYIMTKSDFCTNDRIIVISCDASLETACCLLKEKYPKVHIIYVASLSVLKEVLNGGIV
jgi:hypothetical protein